MQGEWAQRTIPNPHFYEDKEPLKRIGSIGAVAIEVRVSGLGRVLGGGPHRFAFLGELSGFSAAAAAAARAILLLTLLRDC